MTKAQRKAYAEFVSYVRNEFEPRSKGDAPIYTYEVWEEFYALVYRVDPQCPILYEHSFLGVLQ